MNRYPDMPDMPYPSDEERMDASGGEYYVTEIIRRGFQQSRDDYRAKMRRGSDGVELLFFSEYKWLLKRKVRLKAIERAFKRYDDRQRKLRKREVYLK